MSRPTVMLVAPQGFAARFLLRTDILRGLRAGGARVVILAPNADEPYLRAEFGADDVVLEPLRAGTEAPGGSRRSFAFVTLRSHVLAGGHRLSTIRSKVRNRRRGQLSRAGRRAWLTEGPLAVAAWLAWRSRAVRRTLLAIESRLVRLDAHGDVFERHRPDLVVCASPGWFTADAALLREAAARGVRTAALVLGWDNPTSKGYRGATPDLTIAWSQRMADQVAALHDLPPARIAVGGVPHWDPYVRPGALPSREELCAQLGLDPARRIILFATSTPSGYSRNEEVAEALARAIDDGRLGADAQLVVRLHPINFRPGFTPPLDALGELARRHDHVHLDVPEVLSERLRCDLPASDARRLGALLEHCDVLVNVFSTTTLEAFLLDRPVVFVGSGEHEAPRPGMPDPRDYTRYTHLRELVEAGAARVGTTMEELVEHVRTYLAHPELEREARARFAARECGPTDGRSGERIAAMLLELAGAQAGASPPPALRSQAPRAGAGSR